MILNICRTCLVYITEEPKNIFDTDFHTMMTDVLSIQMTEETLPQVICQTCCTLIVNFYRFKQQTLQNDCLLKEYVKRTDQNKPNVHVKDVREKLLELQKQLDIDRQIESNDFLDDVKEENEITTDTDENNLNNKNDSENPRSETLKNKFSCNNCDETFATKTKLTRHTVTHQKFKCSECPKQFTREILLEKHTTRHKSNQLRCSACTETFYEIRMLIRHVKTEHRAKKTITCDKCPEKFYVAQQLNKHLQRTHGMLGQAAKVLCQLCGASVKNLTNHMLIHEENKLAGEKECKECGKMFKTLRRLLNHRKRMHEAKKICHVCGVHYFERKHLRTHLMEGLMESVTNGNGVKVEEAVEAVKDLLNLSCDLCGKKYKTKESLWYHKTYIHNPSVVNCEICNKPVRQKSIKRHIATVHEKIRNFSCSLCAAKFRCAWFLKQHMRMHTDERPYPCKFCDKKFRVKGTLIKHVRIHTGERPYVCKICCKSFNQCTPLKTHMRTHARTGGYSDAGQMDVGETKVFGS